MPAPCLRIPCGGLPPSLHQPTPHSSPASLTGHADTVWLHDPRPYFVQHPAAEWLISTDCLSAAVEEQWAPGHQQPRCGHIPGNNWGR